MTKRRKGAKDNRRRSWKGIICLIGLIFLLSNLSPILQIIYPIPYRQEIARLCEDYQADKALVLSVIYSESRFRSKAVSDAGAKGLMQIMPVTGAWIAQHMGMENYEEALLFDPGTNISMGIWYIGWLETQFDKETPIVLAAYNAGPGTVRKWLQAGIWDGTIEGLDQIPYKETRNYVRRVLDQYASYNKIYNSFFIA
jgi:soluble lytic murein transglycosylase